MHIVFGFQQKITSHAKMQEQNISEVIKQSWKPDWDVIQMLELSDGRFKITVIIVQMALIEKINMLKQIEMQTLRKKIKRKG